MRKTKIDYTSLAGIMLVCGILIMANIIASYVFVRIDLTKNHIYSLSNSSKKILRKLNDKVVIKAYFTQNITPPYSTYRDYLKNLLIEYKNYSHGKVDYTFVSSDNEEKFLEEARGYGIPAVRFQEIRKDKFEVKEGVMGLVVMFEDKSEVMPMVRGIESLEYDLTSRIVKLTRDTKKTVGMATDFGMYGITGNKEVESNISQQYNTRQVSLSGGATVPADIDGLVVIGPSEKLTPEALFAIDQFVMSGKSVLFAIDGYNANLQNFSASEINSGLEDLLKCYGVGFKPGMVIDRSAQNIMVKQSQGFFAIQSIVPYFFVPLVKDFATDIPMVKDLEAIAAPFCKAITFDTQNKNVVFKPLAKSSEYSWVTPVSNVSPYADLAPGKNEELKPSVLIASVEGKFQSYFAGKPLPEKYKNAQIITECPKNRILVCGSGYMFNQEYPIAPSNLVFLQNAIDWLVQDDALTSIRSKDVSFRPIGEVPNWARVIFKNINIFLMPLVFIFYGLFRWKMRKNYRLKIKQEFGK